ncbi:cytoplasmic dynein 2 intermediate chain 1 [Protopterus annectens]|uniref:cytoplasmic dynein 2 intermediate chain 1 n=1 Tax=Protopterus annectens TaxID=7888 RepID=UPI001CFBE812|nr:cytoplasmic dynein 2 intermediate chain 1 [Protopterus annectens]
MDLPPVSEYDMYIKNFGRTNTKQAYVQYNDDNLDRDIQTDEVETLEKWTQFPAAGAVVCGGPTSDSDLSLDFLSTTRIDTPRLTNFLRSACQVMSVLIEEDRAEMQPSQIFKSKGTSLSVCDGCFQFNTNLPFLHDREVHSLSLSLVQRQTIISVHGLPRKPSAVRLDSKFILCVWNIWEPSSPQKVLICESEVRCCCFSPGKATLVFAGTVDGSVVLWDLRERSSLHHTMKIGDFEWIFREPTFCTDGILSTVNHSCPVQAIETISIAAADGKHHSLSFSVPHEESSGLSFQLASLDESGLLNLWVVVELPKADIAGSQLDLGLIPGGKVKLIHSSRINMNSNILQMGAHLGVLQTSSLKFLPSDPNHFIMGTDTGLVSHGTRHGLRTSPRLYKPQQNGPRPVQVTCLNFCPFEETLFLVGCSDGSVRLHRTTSEYPVFQWNDSTKGQPVVFMQWSFTRPAVFFILDAESYIYIWDLLDNDMQPVAQELIQSDKVTTIAVLGDPEKPNALSGLVLAKQSGTIEIQYLNKRWTVIQHEELKKLHKILQFAI